MGIYRHYKGGIYYLEKSYVSPVKHEPDNKNLYVKAKHSETLEEVNVYAIYERGVGDYFFNFFDKNSAYEGSHVLYRGLDGQYWLRPSEMWHEHVNVDGLYIRRFTRASEEELFHQLMESSTNVDKSKK